jgi:hypothetical protein
MASGLPDPLPDGFVNTVNLTVDVKLGEMTWVMDDDVAATFNALPIEEQHRRTELLKHLLTSTAAALTLSAIAEDATVAAIMCHGFDKLKHQANRELLRMSIME